MSMETGVLKVVASRKPLAPRKVEFRVGVGLILSVVISCILIPIINTTDPNALVGLPMEPPSAAHPFGTDTIGRDVFVRVFAAGRLDIVLAVLGVLVPFVFGTVLGTAVGATRNRQADVAVMGASDVIIAFPSIVLVLVIILVFGADTAFGPLPAGSFSILIAVWFVNWTIYTRLARTRTRVIRGDEYIAAGRLLGYSPVRLIRRHLLPSVWTTTATYAVADLLIMIAVIASLPFLGAGIQPPTPEWGAIMYEGRGVLGQAWWISLSTVGVVVVFGVGVTLVVDSLVRSPRKARLP